MPDPRKSGLSKPTLVALVIVVAGALAITVALLSGSSSPNSGNPGQNRAGRAVEPVDPINPNDTDAQQPTADLPKALDVTDPFAASFGESSRRKVTVRVTGNGAVNVGIYFRDKKQDSQRVVNGSFSQTRTFKGRFPMATIAIQVYGEQLPGSATTATCTIVIDGVEVAKQSTKQAGALSYCIG